MDQRKKLRQYSSPEPDWFDLSNWLYILCSWISDFEYLEMWCKRLMPCPMSSLYAKCQRQKLLHIITFDSHECLFSYMWSMTQIDNLYSFQICRMHFIQFSIESIQGHMDTRTWHSTFSMNGKSWNWPHVTLFIWLTSFCSLMPFHWGQAHDWVY